MKYGPSLKFSSSIPLAGDGVAIPEVEAATIGYGPASEVSPELKDVMRRNSEAVDEMMATAKQRDSVEALARAIEKQEAVDDDVDQRCPAYDATSHAFSLLARFVDEFMPNRSLSAAQTKAMHKYVAIIASELTKPERTRIGHEPFVLTPEEIAAIQQDMRDDGDDFDINDIPRAPVKRHPPSLD